MRADGPQKVQVIDMDILVAMQKKVKLDFASFLTDRFAAWTTTDFSTSALGGGYFITALSRALGFDSEWIKLPLTTLIRLNTIENDTHMKDKPLTAEDIRRMNRVQKRIQQTYPPQPADTTALALSPADPVPADNPESSRSHAPPAAAQVHTCRSASCITRVELSLTQLRTDFDSFRAEVRSTLSEILSRLPQPPALLSTNAAAPSTTDGDAPL